MCQSEYLPDSIRRSNTNYASYFIEKGKDSMAHEKCMNLNKETAIRLWAQQFGKRQKAYDFAGREIAKAAYNDRNSNYGWNVDHILPLSKGGKTVDYNLVCCHILSNDEKADKFPCFKSNEKEFEIQRRQNHYEIVERNPDESEKEEEGVNFLDVAQGLRCWKCCKPYSGQTFFGYVKIKVKISNNSKQLLEKYGKFLFELFGTEGIFLDGASCYNSYINMACIQDYVFTVMVGIVPTKEDTENLLDDCVTLNTYSDYFMSKTGFENIQIVCGMKRYDRYLDMLLNCEKDIMKKQVQFTEPLVIDELMKINTSAEKELKDIFSHNGFYSYNFTFTKLKKNLEKYI